MVTHPKGFVSEADGATPAEGASVRVRMASGQSGAAVEDWRSVWSRTDATRGGAYWRILDDGWYDVQAVVAGKAASNTRRKTSEKTVVKSSEIERVRVRNDPRRTEATRLDLKLKSGPVT